MTSTTAPERLRDPDRLALQWYGQPVAALLAGFGVRRIDERSAEALAWAPGVGSGHVVAVTPELLESRPPAGTVVAGGPCIGDCTGFPTLEALVDSVQPILTAKALDAPCVLFVGDAEELMARGGRGRWLKLGERMAGWLEELGEKLYPGRVRVVRTSSEAHEDAVAEGVAALAETEPAALASAFLLGTEELPDLDATDRDVTRRVVAAHAPSVVQRLLDLPAPPTVLVAENVQQLGVVRLLRSTTAIDGTVSFVGHWPVPSQSASFRMYRAEPWDKIPASELASVADGSRPGTHPLTMQYASSWLPPDLR